MLAFCPEGTDSLLSKQDARMAQMPDRTQKIVLNLKMQVHKIVFSIIQKT